jgi:hypothetical protein
MINRIVSLLVLLCVVVVLIWGVLSPSNSLFFFISSNKWLSITRLLVAGFLVWLCFRDMIYRPKHIRLAYKAGLATMGLGMFLFMLTQVQMSMLVDYLKPLDLLLLIEAGVILTSISLSAAPASSPRRQAHRPITIPFNLKAASKVFSIT